MKTTNQYLRWRYKQLTGTGNKYYPKELHQALQDSVRIISIGSTDLADMQYQLALKKAIEAKNAEANVGVDK